MPQTLQSLKRLQQNGARCAARADGVLRRRLPIPGSCDEQPATMATLNPGARIGAFEITARLGAGGMGEVFRARDARLRRDVALKVLPEMFARDPDRMARFEREAQVLAALNHPHIAALYGVEDTGDARALVMELVEGPTLAERLLQGAIPRLVVSPGPEGERPRHLGPAAAVDVRTRIAAEQVTNADTVDFE